MSSQRVSKSIYDAFYGWVICPRFLLHQDTFHGIIPETGKSIEYMMIKTEEQAELARKMNFDVKNSLRNF
jgi:hypothetical protein